MQAFRTETIERDGRRFLVSMHADDDASPPWERSDGHGPVRYCEDREPLQPGETVLYDLRRGRYVYDLRAAISQSIREGWGRPSRERREEIARRLRKPAAKVSAIDADMDFLRGWCAEDWCYMGVCVQILGPDDEPEGDEFAHAVWGVESFGDYWEDVAADLASQILSERREAWRAALREARARRYWAARGVETVGDALPPDVQRAARKSFPDFCPPEIQRKVIR